MERKHISLHHRVKTIKSHIAHKAAQIIFLGV